MSRKIEFGAAAAAALACLLLLAVHARTAILRGPLDWDEGFYLLEAKSLCLALAQMPRLMTHRLSLRVFREMVRAQAGLFPPSTAKPTFTLLLTIAAMLPVPFFAAGNVLSLFTLPLSSWVLYRSCRISGVRAPWAMVAAALLVCSPLWGYYGLSGLPNAVAGFLLLATLHFYLRDRFDLAGFAAGAALTTHYGLLPSVMLTFGIMAVESLRSFGPAKGVTKIARAGLFFASPLLIWELVYRLFSRVASRPEFGRIVYRTYFQQILNQLAGSRPTVQPSLYAQALRHNFHMFGCLLRYGGWPSAGLFLASALLILINIRRAPKKAVALLAAAIAISFAWLLNPGVVVSRVVMFILPFYFMCFAASLALWQGQSERVQAGFIAICLGCVAWGAGQSFRADALLRSPFLEASAYLARVGYDGDVLDPFNSPIWRVYLGRRLPASEHLRSLDDFEPAARADLQSTPPPGIAVFLQDAYRNSFELPLPNFFRNLARRTPVQRFSMPYGRNPLWLFESYSSADISPEGPRWLNMYWLTQEDLSARP